MSYFCPMPSRYGVMRIDPISSVQHLEDALASEEATKLRTAYYLVYLDQELQLPFPDMPWFRFGVTPIGQGLRPESPEKGYTKEMCVPIFPNETHPTGCPPVRTNPDFPFPNCYHWYGTGMDVRIRAKPNQECFDGTHAIRLPVKAQIAMAGAWAEYRTRQKAVLAKFRGLETPRSSTEGDPEDTVDAASLSSRYATSTEDDCISLEPSEAFGDDLEDTGVFGNADDAGLDLPLVDFSFDLALVDPDRLPSPMDMLAEREALSDIIKRARERLNPTTSYAGSAANDNQSGLAQTARPLVVHAEDNRRRGFAMLKLPLRKRWNTGTTRLIRRVCRAVRPPYLVAWP